MTTKRFKTFAQVCKALKVVAAAWDIEFDTTFHTSDILIDINVMREWFKEAKKDNYHVSYELYWRDRGVNHDPWGWEEKLILMTMVVTYDNINNDYVMTFTR